MRYEKNQCASAQNRGQSQSQQQAVQTVEKNRGLIVGFEHAQAHRGCLVSRKFQGSSQETFVAQLDLFGLRNAGSGMHTWMPRKLGLMRRIQGASDNRIAIVESYLAGSNPAHLRRDGIVNFVTDRQKTQQIILRRRASIDGLEKDLIQMPSPEPPLA